MPRPTKPRSEPLTPSAVLDAAERLQSATVQDEQAYKNLLIEKMKRDAEALRIYEPMPHQEAFHATRVSRVIMQKGNRTGGPQQTSEPVLTPTGWTPIGELRVGDKVMGGDGKPCTVTGIFPQGWKAIFRVTFDDGASTICCEDHLWKCKITKAERFPSHPNYKADKWVVRSLYDIRKFGGDNPLPRERAEIPVAVCEFDAQEVPLDPYTLGVLLGDGCIAHESAHFSCGDGEVAEMVAVSVGVASEVKSRGGIEYSIISGMGTAANGGRSVTNPVVRALRELELMGTKSENKFIPAVYHWNTSDVRLNLLQGLMDTDGYADKRGLTFFYTCSPQLATGFLNVVRSLGGKGSIKWKETFITTRTKTRGRPPRHAHTERDLFKRRCLNMAVVSFRLPEGMCPFRLERKVERWKKYGNFYTGNRLLVSIEPAGNAECVCISVDSADHTYVTRDYIVTHNTLSLAVEIARAVTGQDPHNKYPKTNGIACCLGYGEGHIGRVFHRLLFRPGAFDMIRDTETQRWRAYRPWPQAEGGDLERAKEAKPAPPLIPKRFIDGEIVWGIKGEKVFKVVRFINGWELYAFNSAGDPSQAQGFDAHLYAVDEDTAETGWIEESFGRLSKTGGLFRWTALPHGKNDEMMQLLERAEKDQDKAEPGTIVLRSTIYDNKYLPADSVKAAVEGWKAQGEDVYRKRALGELSIGSVRMYPTFNRRVHDVMNSSAVPTEAQTILKDRLGDPPADWTRYAVVDPGHQICAVLFVAIPPPSLGTQMFVYDELYIPEATARHFGEGMEIKCRDNTFEAFIIDMHGGRLTGIASGDVPVDKYAEQLRDRGVRSEQTQHNFRHGCDEIKRREDELRTRLAIQANSAPGTMVVVGRCPNLCREMEKFRKKTIRQSGKDVVIEVGDRRAGTHAVECWEMAVSSELTYVKPRDKAVKEEWVDHVIRMDKHREEVRRAKARAFGGGGHISLGPIGAK